MKIIVFKNCLQITLVIFLIAIVIDSFGTDYISNQSGDWGSKTIWTPNGIPGSGDKVIILNGHDIDLSGKKAFLLPFELYINKGGALNVSLKKKSLLFSNANSKIEIAGTLTLKECEIKDPNDDGSLNASIIVKGTGVINGSKSKDIEVSNLMIESGGEIQNADDIYVLGDGGSLTVDGTINVNGIHLTAPNQKVLISVTALVTLSDELTADKNSDFSTIVIDGRLIADKIKLEDENQTLIISYTGNVTLSDDFEAKKPNASITVNGSLIVSKDLKLGDNKGGGVTNHIVGSGIVTAKTYDLKEGSTVLLGFIPLEEETITFGTLTWTGADVTSPNAWNVATNWDNNTFPVSTTNVIIPATVASGKWPVISVGESFSINSLTIESATGGTGSLINLGSLSISGAVNIERYIPTDDWHIISSPVGVQSMGQFSSANNLGTNDGTYDLAPYNESLGEWGPFTVTANTGSSIGRTKGYLLRLPEGNGGRAVTFTGSSINSGTQSRSIDSTRWGWNSVGNPYTSSIRINAASNSFLATNSDKLSAAYGGLYFWDQGFNDYRIMENGGSDVITSGQGFVLKCKEGGSQTVTFHSNMQVHSSSIGLKSEEIPIPEIRLLVESGDLRNRTRIKFITGKTPGLDPGYDVGKLKGNPDIALYTKLADSSSDVDFGVQTLPDVSFETLIIPVGLDLAGGGNVKFTAEISSGFPEGTEIYLEDTELETLTQLNKTNASYMVTVDEMNSDGRFYMVFTNNTGKEITTGMEEIINLPQYKVFIRDKLIFIEGPADNNTVLALYGVDGKVWHQKKAENLNQNKIDGSGFPAGIYFLKILQNGSRQTHKLVITE